MGVIGLYSKIHRRGPSVFSNRRQKVKKAVGWVVLGVLAVTVGYLTMKYVIEHPGLKTASSTSSNETASTEAEAQTAETEPAASVDETEPTSSTETASPSGGLRAFYLPVAQLGNTAALDTQLDVAAKAGFNAVLFDLKDVNGAVHYQSATELAQKAQAAASDALTLDALKTALQHLKDKGFTAIPRLYAFQDPAAPSKLSSAKVMLKDQPSYTWLDNSKEKGGKAWLNPYSPDAHRYIIDMAKELAGAGFTNIMLDGVQFPNQTSRAYYGNTELSSLSQSAVLTKFVTDCSTAVGSGCRVMLSMPGLSAFGDGTTPFGGNPVTFGAKTVSPVLLPSTLGSKLTTSETSLSDPASDPYNAVKIAAGQVNLRLQLIAESDRPEMMPWLQADSYSADQINQEIKAVNETLGSEASYILYSSKTSGGYDFASIKQQG